MNRYAISIPKPCHEDWAGMTAEEKGRFCAVCQKTVVDFTAMDAKQVDDFFDTNAGTKVCGRFNTDQLSEPVKIEIPRQALLMQRSFLNIFLLALAISMGTTLFSCKRATGEPALVGEIAVVDSTAIDTASSAVPRGSREEKQPSKDHLEAVESDPVQTVTGTPMIEPTIKHLTGDTVAEPVKGKVKVSE